MSFALTDAQHRVRVELWVGDELIGTYTIKASSLLDAIKLPDGHVLSVDPRLVRVDCLRIVPTVYEPR
jgi:hypothetical protein